MAARILPVLTDAELSSFKSRAEARVYRLCRGLPSRMLILCRLDTLVKGQIGPPREGEADFVVFDPDYGMLVIEVKGGGITYDALKDQWQSRDEQGAIHDIKDPFQQGRSRKHDLLLLLQQSPAWQSIGISWLLAGHAVLFPDLDDLSAIRRPDADVEIMGGRQQVRDLESWLKRVFTYWGAQGANTAVLGTRGRDAAERILCSSFSVYPRLGARIEREQDLHATWTHQQWLALQGLRHWRRIGVSGGAGTGKTLLAVRRAQQLASEGKRTLLICFNAALGDFLKKENQAFLKASQVAAGNLHTMTFHDLATWWVGVASGTTGVDYLGKARGAYRGRSERDVIWPCAVGMALLDHPHRYDAVLVDEGQDFGPEYWMPIEDLAQDGLLAVFYDPNQAIYQKPKEFPIETEQTYELTRNCRNTGHIHRASYHQRYYKGPTVDPPEEDGVPVVRWVETNLDAQARLLGRELRKLIGQEHVLAKDIAVLLLDGQHFDIAFQSLSQETKKSGPALSRKVHGDDARVLVDTVARFKGLERAVIVLWLNRAVESAEARQLHYVALSRPCSQLVVLGTEAMCRAVLDGP